MAQELGETSQEMMKADDQAVQDILNRRPKGHYWIVIHHKPINRRLTTGEKVMMRLVKDYNKKPRNNLGTVVLEVNDGEIVSHAINLHDAPIDWGKIIPSAGLIETPYVQRRSDISGAYLYNQ